MNLQRLIRTFRAGNGFDEAVLVKKLNITAAEKGSCTATFKADSEICNNEDFLAGSFITTVFDTISSLGAMTLTNKVHVSVNINVSYFEPVKMGDEIIVDSKVIKSGKNLLYLEGIFKNKTSGNLVAKGTHVKYVLEKNMFD